MACYAAFRPFFALTGLTGMAMPPKAMPAGSQRFSFSACCGVWPCLSGSAKARASWSASNPFLSFQRACAHGSPSTSRPIASSCSRVMRFQVIRTGRTPVARHVAGGQRQGEVVGGGFGTLGDQLGLERHRHAVGQQIELLFAGKPAELLELGGFAVRCQPVEREFRLDGFQRAGGGGFLDARRRELFAEMHVRAVTQRAARLTPGTRPGTPAG